jgi:hypothetical protein
MTRAWYKRIASGSLKEDDMFEMISGLAQMTAALIGIEIKEKVVRLKTERFGYLCLNTRRPAFYISPNGSMYASTMLIGQATREQKLDAVRRRTIFGLHPTNLTAVVGEGIAWKDYLMFRSDMELQTRTSCENCHRALTRFEAYHTNVCTKCLTSELKRLLKENEGVRQTVKEVDELRMESYKKVRKFRERICQALVYQDHSEIYDDFGTLRQDLLLDTDEGEQEWQDFIRNLGAGGA